MPNVRLNINSATNMYKVVIGW